MGQIQYRSSHAVINKVMRDFKPVDNGWTADALEWIGEGLQEMRLAPAYAITAIEVDVCNYRAKIPCGAETLHGIIHLATYSKLKLLNPNALLNIEYGTLDKFRNMPAHWNNELYYQVNADFFIFNFKEGKIRIYYDGFILDSAGYPMIPDEAFIMNALAWKIMYFYLLRGGTHPVLTYDVAQQNYLDQAARADGRVKDVSPERYERLLNNFTALIPTISRQDDMFTNIQYLSNETFIPTNYGTV